MIKTTALKDIPVGKNFKVWNREFTVLKQEEDKTFVLAAEFATTMPFRKKSQNYKVAANDFRDSSVKKYLNDEYLDELEEAGADIYNDILPLTIDLKCTMGQHEYDTDIVLAGLLTLEQYGEFYDIIPLIETDWWCLATPWKTPNRSRGTNDAGNGWIWYVNTDGGTNDYNDGAGACDWLCGIRPALNLNPELIVTYELEENTDNWSDYIKYLNKWAVEHDDKAFTGNSPACYDEWLDNENKEE